MERWHIQSSPSSSDPQRHLLLIRGGMTDVAAILKKFGARCGRPTPLDGDDFNLSFVLHRMTPEVRKKFDDWLGKRTPPPAPRPTEPLKRGRVTEPSGEAALPTDSGRGIPSLRARSEASPLTPLADDPIRPEPAIPPPPIPAVATTEPSGEATPTARSADAAAPSSTSPLSETLRSGWTFESLLVGAYNRFAHAAAMSVVSSPGSMYNPLFLYGVPGTGKSHLLHAVATATSKGLGDTGLLVTSGSRLARAVSAAAARGETAEIDKKIADSRAIFVDDIHLMAVTEQNKELLAKLFKSFFDRNLQVVITSLYPPRALGALEEALQFSFSKGWSVDLKIPSPDVQKDLVASVCDRFAAQFNGDDIRALHEKLAQWGYQDLTLWIHRLAVLRRVREATGKSATLMDLLMLTYEPIVAADADTLGAPAPAWFAPPATGAAAEPMAVIVPKGHDGLGPFAASLFYEVGGKNGFPPSCRCALWETYDAMQQVGVPFQIVDMCHRAQVTRALVIGPGPDSPLAPRAHEFGHAVRRILDGAGTQTGWIPFSGLRIEAHYLNAHLDFDATGNTGRT